MIFGAANQAGEDNRNVARMGALMAGLPNTVGGNTVNRLCASGLQAIVDASRSIMVGDGEIYIAGGVGLLRKCGRQQHGIWEPAHSSCACRIQGKSKQHAPGDRIPSIL